MMTDTMLDAILSDDVSSDAMLDGIPDAHMPSGGMPDAIADDCDVALLAPGTGGLGVSFAAVEGL